MPAFLLFQTAMTEDSFRTILSVGRAELIDELNEDAQVTRKEVVKGIGDDAAVVRRGGERMELLSSESFMEGVDFDLTYTPLHHLGYKVVTAAVSDIYAMNGSPDLVLLNLAVPNKLSVEMLREIYRGVHAACADYTVQLAGGDLAASHQLLSISVTATGTVEEDRITWRKGAAPDDAVCLSGDLGGAIAGLRILMREKEFWEEHQQDAFQPDLGDYEYPVRRQLVPVARHDLTALFEEHEIVPSSMIDVSQGLVSSLKDLGRASGLGSYIYQATLPVALETRQVADEMKEDVDKYALYGGEDYELLFTLPEADVERLEEVFNDFVIIGKIVEEPSVKMQNAEGDVIEF